MQSTEESSLPPAHLSPPPHPLPPRAPPPHRRQHKHHHQQSHHDHEHHPNNNTRTIATAPPIFDAANTRALGRAGGIDGVCGGGGGDVALALGVCEVGVGACVGGGSRGWDGSTRKRCATGGREEEHAEQEDAGGHDARQRVNLMSKRISMCGGRTRGMRRGRSDNTRMMRTMRLMRAMGTEPSGIGGGGAHEKLLSRRRRGRAGRPASSHPHPRAASLPLPPLHSSAWRPLAQAPTPHLDPHKHRRSQHEQPSQHAQDRRRHHGRATHR